MLWFYNSSPDGACHVRGKLCAQIWEKGKNNKKNERGIHKLSYEIMIENVLKEFIEVWYSVIES